MPDSCVAIRALESQRAAGKAIYGGGLLLGGATAEKKKAAEIAAAKKAAAAGGACAEDGPVKWQLSDAEREIINGLK